MFKCFMFCLVYFGLCFMFCLMYFSSMCLVYVSSVYVTHCMFECLCEILCFIIKRSLYVLVQAWFIIKTYCMFPCAKRQDVMRCICAREVYVQAKPNKMYMFKRSHESCLYVCKSSHEMKSQELSVCVHFMLCLCVCVHV